MLTKFKLMQRSLLSFKSVFLRASFKKLFKKRIKYIDEANIKLNDWFVTHLIAT